MYINSMQVKTVCPPSIVVMQVVKRKKERKVVSRERAREV
jgi:hypothetical protein